MSRRSSPQRPPLPAPPRRACRTVACVPPDCSTGNRGSSALVAVVTAEPVHEVSHALFNGCRGPVTDIPHQVIDIRIRRWYIAFLHGQEVLLCLASQALLDYFNVTHELHRLVVADVVQAVRSAAGCGV